MKNEGIKALALGTAVVLSACGESYDYNLERKTTQVEIDDKLNSLKDEYVSRIINLFNVIPIRKGEVKKVYLGKLPENLVKNVYYYPHTNLNVYAEVLCKEDGRVDVNIYFQPDVLLERLSRKDRLFYIKDLDLKTKK
jgi:hypothetical protein